MQTACHDTTLQSHKCLKGFTSGKQVANGAKQLPGTGSAPRYDLKGICLTVAVAELLSRASAVTWSREVCHPRRELWEQVCQPQVAAAVAAAAALAAAAVAAVASGVAGAARQRCTH